MRAGWAIAPVLMPVAAALAMGANAQTAGRSYDLPAQPMAAALARFAETSGVQVLFDPAVVRRYRAHDVRGVMPVETALARLLAGSGLEFQRSEPGLYLIRPRRRVPDQAREEMPVAPPHLPDFVPAPIVVTAARHAQSVQRVSAVVDVVAGPSLAAGAVSSAGGAIEGITGVSTTSQPGGVSINIRGLGADMPSGATEGSVALEFDGIYNAIALGTATGFFDVDRVEVIKGPQSTRYGPNAEGGIVNVISRDPVIGVASGTGAVTTGSAGLLRVEAAQTVPLGSAWALRIAAVSIRRESWFTPALADTVGQSLRAKLLFAPDPSLSVLLTGQVDHIGGTGSGSEAGYPILISHVAPYPGDSINATGNPWAQGDRADGGYDPAASRADLTQTTLVGTAGWRPAAPVALDVTASHLGIAGSQTGCARPAPPWAVSGPGLCYAIHEFAPFGQTMAEARLHSPATGRLQWNVGLYFWQFGKTSWAAAFQAVPGPAGAEHIGTRTLALFAEATVPVASGLRVVAGLRQSLDHRSLRPAGVSQTYTADFAHTDVRLGIEADLSGTAMAYATLATGYRPGGLSYDGATGEATTFASEDTRAWEAGVKSTLWQGRLRLNLGGFLYRQRNYQDLDSYNGFAVTLPSGGTYLCGPAGGQPPQCSLPSFNIPRASNVGIDWQAKLNLTTYDRLTANGTLMRARFGTNLGACATVAAPSASGCWIGYNDQLTGALHFYRVNGAVQPHAPNLSLTVGYEHAFVLASGWQVVPGAQAEHDSSYWVGPVEDSALLGFQPGFWLGSASLRVSAPGGQLTFSAWVKNLGNYAVKMSTLPAPTIGDPRNFGLSAGWRW